ADTARQTLIVAWDNGDRILHHTQRSFDGQLLRDTLPQLGDMAKSQSNGIRRLQVNNGGDYVVAVAPLPRLNINIAVGRDRSTAIASAHRWGIAGVVIAVALGSLLALL